MVFILALLTVSLASAQAEPIEYPAPTGPYQVGSTYRHWVDESRDETLTDDPDDKRELMVRFWYPAKPAPDAVPMSAIPHAAVQIPVLDRIVFPGLNRHFNRIAAFQSHSYLDAPLATSSEPYPVLLFSHGYGGMPELHSLQLEELASHGYVVAATYHTLVASATVFPDGRVVEFLAGGPSTAVADQKFVMDQLALLNTDDPEGFFTGRLQTERFGVFGMSFGGSVADGVCKTDSRCAAYVNEDEATEGRFTVEALPPVMFMSSRDDLSRGVFSRWRGSAYNLLFKSFRHGNFSDAVLWPPVAALRSMLGTASPEEALRSVNAYLVAFFDKYMKGIDSPLLDGPSADFPNVEFESRNIE